MLGVSCMCYGVSLPSQESEHHVFMVRGIVTKPGE